MPARRTRTISGQEVTPKKSLGQNFLLDPNLARWIADQIEPDDAPFVAEIGPGLGALTAHLAGRARRLCLVEKDSDLALSLGERYRDHPAVEVRHDDASRMDLRDWYRHGDVRVIGNLPYSVGGEILKRCLNQPTPVTRAVFMLQKEVCDRLAARLGDAGYGALSLLVQKDWDVELLRVVPPEVFKPRPKVDSAVIRLTPRAPGSLPVFGRAVFDRLVRMGFSQRRKQLKNLLPDAPGGWEALVSHLGAEASVRAEELSLAQWVALARHYEERGPEDHGQRASEVFDVVDSQNRVTGQAARGEVHARKLLHRAVHILVTNRRGEVFLQKRSHLKDVSPLKWDSSAAGHLDAGEGYAAAALRELREELGIEAQGTELLHTFPGGEDTDFEFVELHLARHHGPVRCPAEEIDSGEWFRPRTITEWVGARPQDFAKGFVRCWRAYARMD